MKVLRAILFIAVFFIGIVPYYVVAEDISTEAEDISTVAEDVAVDTEVTTVDPEVLDRMRQMEDAIVGQLNMTEEVASLVDEAKASYKIPVDIILDGSFLKTDVEALIINGRTYAPLRALCEAYNLMDITWDDHNYRAIVMKDGQKVIFPVNDNRMVVDLKEIMMDSPSLLIDGRIMIPIRYISEWLGFDVRWDGTFYIVDISAQPDQVMELNSDRLAERQYSIDELKTFSRLVMKEAGSVSYETMHGVASVVMNQVAHPGLEDTIHDVIYDKSGSVHFPPAHKEGFHDTVPFYNCVLAVKKVLRGENSVGSCIYFNTSPFRGKTVYKVVDGVYFCY